MSFFEYSNNLLYFDGVEVEKVAQEFKTPLYLYSAGIFKERMSRFEEGRKDHPDSTQFCFAVKSCSNLSILRLFADQGWGADIVSGGELYRALLAGIDPAKIVFSGVGKTEAEIEYALDSRIMLFSCESEDELEKISQIVQARGQNEKAPVSLRINPDVDAKTHPYISTGLKENKFGISYNRILDAVKLAQSLPGIDLCGLGYHIGSQLLYSSVFTDAAAKVADILREVRQAGVQIRYVDAGGGLGIEYESSDAPLDPAAYVKLIRSELSAALEDAKLLFEPGRSLSGNSGILITKILYSKLNHNKQFFICDAAMNDLIRPALYQGYHEVYSSKLNTETVENADLVGPVCETGDFFAKGRRLPAFLPGDYAVLASAGAYGFVMASNYNARVRPAEALIDPDGSVRLIRSRESLEDLVRGEIEYLD